VCSRESGLMAATLCLIVYALVLANFVVPCLRFDAPSANEAFFCIAQLLPIAAVAIVAPRFRGRLKSAALRFPLPVLFVGLDTADLSEEYASIVTDRGRVVAYPTVGGGVVYRQECELLPGLRAVRDLGSDFPVQSAQLSWSGGITVIALAQDVGDGISQVRTPQELLLVQLPCRSGAG
jgi:hypothetical protein